MLLEATHAAWSAMTIHTTMHYVHTTIHTTMTAMLLRSTFVLGCRGGDAHGSVATKDALHLLKRVLLIGFFAEANKAIAARHGGDRVGHDFGGFA